VYFSVITYSTIGFGDFAPNSTGGRMFVSLFAFCFGLPMVSFQIASAGNIGDSMMDYAERRGRSSSCLFALRPLDLYPAIQQFNQPDQPTTSCYELPVYRSLAVLQ
jgi:Ion channel